MINLQTLGGLLRILQPAEVTPKTAQPLEPLVAVQSVKPVATEAAQAWRTTDAHSQAMPGGAPFPGGRAQAQAGTASSLQLSRAAAVLDGLMRLPGGQPIREPRPLATNPGDVVTIARALGESIARSGLFYESHLAAAFLKPHPSQPPGGSEPQLSWPAQPALAAPADGDTALPGSAPAAGSPTGSPAGLPAGTPAPMLPEPAAALVRQQVEVLETGRILWQGEPWPGQPARIEIEEEPRGGEPGVPGPWRTRVALDLPGLGRVEAFLALAGSRLQLELRVADEGSRALLRDSLPSLAKALSARSLELGGIVVRHEPAR